MRVDSIIKWLCVCHGNNHPQEVQIGTKKYEYQIWNKDAIICDAFVEEGL